ncbi:MAG: phenylalanine--tRNA ligase subunit beta [Saprospiraceae bacterium]|nr:phenylalanine--tRNA ligase subunit beta [Saprospiraceae bacterium]
MNVSLNWLKQYMDISLTSDEVSELLTDLGLEVEGMEHVGNDLAGVVVGHVLECEKVPDTKLSLTKVDVSGESPLQIICGAPNVAAGQKVVVALVGTTLTFSDGKSLTLTERPVRGMVSQGMICAEDELGLGTDHSGIIVLPESTVVGTPAKEVFGLEKDVVFEVGLTPNRSDAMGHLGIARDLAARLKVHHGGGDVRLPDVSAFKVDSTALPIQVAVEDTEGCPRYSGVCIKGVTIGESPNWLKNRLAAIGVNSINNVVDITNFVLHEIGQPLHAFDYDKIGGASIVVKTLPTDTKFKSLKKNELGENVVLNLTNEDLMICDADSTGMCIAGVIGNPTEGVSATTTNIFLESAHFNGKRLRRTSFYHNTRTDAAKTFEKGTDPNVTLFALKRAALLIKELAGGEIASEVVDIYPKPIDNPRITVNFENVERLIGQKFDNRYLKKILAALDMDIVETIDSETVVVSVPTNKSDVLREADVIEEILRIHGFNNVPMPNQIRSAIIETDRIDRNRVKNLIADFLASNGFNEAMALSLSQSKFYKNVELVDNERLVYVNNTSNVHLDIMRPTMLVSALEAIAHNQNRQSADLRLFEFGKTYLTEGEGFEETAHLAIVVTGSQTGESWRAKNGGAADFYTLKTYVTGILGRLGIGGLQETSISNAQFAFGLKYHRGAQTLVEFGKVQPKLRKAFDVKQDVYFADFQWDNIIKALKNAKVGYSEISKYPSVRRDLALVLDTSRTFGEIAQIAQKTAKKLLKDVNLFDVFEDETKLGAGKKSYAVSFVFEDKDKTLGEKDIEKVMSDLIGKFEKDLGALIRR